MSKMSKYLLVLVLLVSCANPKKLHKMMDKLPEATAKECDQRFPIKETTDTLTVTDTALVKAYEEEYLRVLLMLNDLMNKGCDTIVSEKIKEVVKTLPAKTNTRVVVRTQESTAKLEVLKNDCEKTIKSLSQINTKIVTDLQKLELKNEKLKTRNRWMWVIIVCLTIFAFRRQILKLIIK